MKLIVSGSIDFAVVVDTETKQVVEVQVFDHSFDPEFEDAETGEFSDTPDADEIAWDVANAYDLDILVT